MSFISEERRKEEEHLKECVDTIQKNVEHYEQKLTKMSEEIRVMYDNYHSNNPELHNELVISIGMKEQLEHVLNKNMAALHKPYFGRIDFKDKEDGFFHSFYLGKNGVMKNNTEVMVVDWRAPVSSIYYDCQVGDGTYQIPEQESRRIELSRKRTYEIEQSQLIDYYDAEVIANDELLTKYLAKNKEAVLGEIIATIQKEQNEIIRESPFHNIIVQGVAGSGKTTVAMHRISYILYNYGHKFREDEFYIIGSNQMLLNYITSVLPDLDVHHVKHMVMEEFFIQLLGRDFNLKKQRIRYRNVEKVWEIDTVFMNWKGSLDWINRLDQFLEKIEAQAIATDAIYYNDTEIYSTEAIHEFLQNNKNYSVQEKINQLNKRIVNKIQMFHEKIGEEKEIIRREGKKYQDYFGKKSWKIPIIQTYKEFIWELSKEHQKGMTEFIKQLEKEQYDVYDLASLLYIKFRLKRTVDFDEAKHIVIDEAQDFGVSIFAVLKRLLPKTTFTIMGDVSQNINYDSGMNDWEALKEYVFSREQDKFYLLAKSYRNTIEISNFAGTILKHCSFQTYDISPIIRHGAEVGMINVKGEQQMLEKAVAIIEGWKKSSYDTIAVICREPQEAQAVQEQLGQWLKVEETDTEQAAFTKGVMVLPIYLTKGLEFDTVLIWNPNRNQYPKNDGMAKLLYVAATRALHELSIIYTDELSELFNPLSEE